MTATYVVAELEPCILNPIHTTSDLVTSVCFHSLSSLLKDLAAVVGEALFFSACMCIFEVQIHHMMQ